MEGHTTIKINGQSVDLIFGLPSFIAYKETIILGKELTGIDWNTFFIKTVLHTGYINACKAKNIFFPPFKVEDFHCLVEDHLVNGEVDEINNALQVWSHSKEVIEKRVIKALPEQEKKKTRRQARAH